MSKETILRLKVAAGPVSPCTVGTKDHKPAGVTAVHVIVAIPAVVVPVRVVVVVPSEAVPSTLTGVPSGTGVAPSIAPTVNVAVVPA